MKHLLLIVLAFNLSFTSLSGQYASIFGNEYSEWHYLSPFCDYLPSSFYSYEKDSLIDGKNYRLLRLESGFILKDHSFVRASQDNSKIWLLEPSEEREYLVFDLNLETGDEFRVGSERLVVDSVFDDNGNKNIQLNYTPPNCWLAEKIRFIEGTGPTVAFDYLKNLRSDYSTWIRCHTKDDSINNFLFDLFGDCDDPIRVSTDETRVSKMKLYPTPASNVLYVSTESTITGKLEIYNLAGRRCHRSDYLSENQIQVDISDLRSGIYFLVISHDQGHFSRKFLKQ